MQLSATEILNIALAIVGILLALSSIGITFWFFSLAKRDQEKVESLWRRVHESQEKAEDLWRQMDETLVALSCRSERLDRMVDDVNKMMGALLIRDQKFDVLQKLLNYPGMPPDARAQLQAVLTPKTVAIPIAASVSADSIDEALKAVASLRPPRAIAVQLLKIVASQPGQFRLTSINDDLYEDYGNIIRKYIELGIIEVRTDKLYVKSRYLSEIEALSSMHE